jgi:ATP-binding cassette subfamily B protein
VLARRAAEFVRPYKFAVLRVVVLALVLAVLGAADPLVMKWLFDALAGPRAMSVLPFAVGALLALELSRAVLGALLGNSTWDIRLGVDFRLRERLVSKLTALPISYHQEAGVGGTMNRVSQASQAFVAAFGEIAFNVLPAVVYLALSLVAMLRMDWRLAVVVLVFTPLPALIGAWAATEQTRRERALMERWTKLYGRINEVLSGIRTVKAYGMEDAERRRFVEQQRDGNEIVRRGVRTDARTGALRGLAATMARLTAIAVGGLLIVRGEITLGTLVAFLGYVGGLFGPVQGLTNVYQTLRKATVALETIFDILDADEVVSDAPDARELERPTGEIRFERVTFSYAPGTPVVRDVDLVVNPGETLALVGPSGGGKTTLVTLLQRLVPLEHGRITIDGEDIRGLTQRSLRRHIGVVSQDFYLFNDTVGSNIAYGRPDASLDEIAAAATAAEAHEFILSLPDGYETVIGERGSRLSGGQRQRVAIARALLRDPPILILDEATSALDTLSEQLVQESLATLRRGRTTIVIAHRLSTVLDADRIAVLRDGQILACGRHEQLMHECPYYASLVDGQSDGVLLTQAA